MPDALEIAVISDTHNEVPDRLIQLIELADEIWHLGDVCTPETLEAFTPLPGTLTVVQGNNDPCFLWEERVLLNRNGMRFHLQHMPPHSVDPSLTALLFGHMHYPINECMAGVPTLNPGAITAPKRHSSPSFGWLKISSEGEWAWEIQEL